MQPLARRPVGQVGLVLQPEQLERILIQRLSRLGEHVLALDERLGDFRHLGRSLFLRRLGRLRIERQGLGELRLQPGKRPLGDLDGRQLLLESLL